MDITRNEIDAVTHDTKMTGKEHLKGIRRQGFINLCIRFQLSNKEYIHNLENVYLLLNHLCLWIEISNISKLFLPCTNNQTNEEPDIARATV